MSVPDRKLRSLIINKLDLQVNDMTAKYVKHIVQLQLQYNRAQWEAEYDQSIEAHKFDSNQQIAVSDFFTKFKRLIEEGIEPGQQHIENIQCVPAVSNGKLRVMINVTGNNFIK